MASRFDLLLTGGTVLDPASGRHGRFDVAIRDGRIAAIEPQLSPDGADRVVYARGRYVTPGLIDFHVHSYWGEGGNQTGRCESECWGECRTRLPLQIYGTTLQPTGLFPSGTNSIPVMRMHRCAMLWSGILGRCSKTTICGPYGISRMALPMLTQISSTPRGRPSPIFPSPTERTKF